MVGRRSKKMLSDDMKKYRRRSRKSRNMKKSLRSRKTRKSRNMRKTRKSRRVSRKTRNMRRSSKMRRSKKRSQKGGAVTEEEVKRSLLTSLPRLRVLNDLNLEVTGPLIQKLEMTYQVFEMMYPTEQTRLLIDDLKENEDYVVENALNYLLVGRPGDHKPNQDDVEKLTDTDKQSKLKDIMENINLVAATGSSSGSYDKEDNEPVE